MTCRRLLARPSVFVLLVDFFYLNIVSKLAFLVLKKMFERLII